jgi:hypothetical protein
MKVILTSLLLFTLVFVQAADLDGFNNAKAEVSVSHDAGGTPHPISESNCGFHSGCHFLHHMFFDAAPGLVTPPAQASASVSSVALLYPGAAYSPPVPPPLV